MYIHIYIYMSGINYGRVPITDGCQSQSGVKSFVSTAVSPTRGWCSVAPHTTTRHALGCTPAIRGRPFD